MMVFTRMQMETGRHHCFSKLMMFPFQTLTTKDTVLRRLLSLKRKLLNGDKLKADYLGFMKKTIDDGQVWVNEETFREAV